MATAVKPEKEQRMPEQPRTVPFGRLEDLLSKPVQYRDVEIDGKRFRLRELKQGEVEEIGHHVVKQDSDAEGRITTTADSRGYKARVIAYALVKEDGSQYLAAPAVEWETINRLTPQVVDVLFRACDELNLLTKGAKDEMGKSSAPAKAGPTSSG